MQTLKMTWLLLLAGAVATAACGDSKSSLNPTAPSAVTAVALNEEASGAEGESGATDKGGKGKDDKEKDKGKDDKDKDKGKDDKDKGKNEQPQAPSAPQPPSTPQPPSNTSPGAPSGAKVEIEGLISAVAVGSITVNGQTILVTADTVIRHGDRRFVFSDLKIGDRVHVKATRDGSAIRASEVKLQNRDDDDDDDDEDDDEDDDDEDDEDDDDDDDDDDRVNRVAVAAFDSSASETGPNTGTFRLLRAGSLTLLASPLTVTFTLTGTATNGADYTNLPLTATFAAGQSSVDVVVTPLADPLVEGNETVILTLTGVAPYLLGSPVSATVTISDPLPQVGVVAQDATASESGDTGMFRLTRTGDLTASLAVTVTLTGTATNGTDYDLLSTTVTFAAGSATANVFVVPMADAVVDPSETAILTVVDGATYDLGATPQATVTITGT